MSEAEYARLEEDIKARGVLVPVELDDQGNILDGHNRVEIAEKWNKPWRDNAVVRVFETEEQKREHVIKLNLCRRQMGIVCWGLAFIRLCEQHNVPLGSGGVRRTRRSDKAETERTANVAACDATVASLAAQCGVSERTARRRMAAARKCETMGDKMLRAVSPKPKVSTKQVRETIGNEDGVVWRRVSRNLEAQWGKVGHKQRLGFFWHLWRDLSSPEQVEFLRWVKNPKKT